jgi:hypothetical protein
MMAGEIQPRRESMSKINPRCPDCGCLEFTKSERHAGRYLLTRDISFSCGARQRDFADLGSSLGRVAFEGCDCRTQGMQQDFDLADAGPKL